MDTADSDALVRRFWQGLQRIRTGMLGLVGAREAHSQPMTAHFDGSDGPLWFYTRSDSGLAAAVASHERGVFHYAGPDHELFACVHGRLSIDRDPAVIDRFWTEEVARWFPHGRATVSLLKFDPQEAQIWLPASSADMTVARLGSSGQQPVDIRATATL